MKKKKKRLLLINFFSQGARNAVFSISARLRVEVFKRLGFEVIFFGHPKSGRFRFFTSFLRLISLARKADLIYVRADGSVELEIFSLLKLVAPKTILVWEVHAPVEEHFWKKKNFMARIKVWTRGLKRKILSKFVDGAVCLSDPLKKYAEEKLGLKNCRVIPSFINISTLKKTTKLSDQAIVLNRFLQKERKFKVFWGGTARFRWQALDLIEQVAKKIYRLDKEIVFLIFAGDSWHQFSFFKNIIIFSPLPQKDFWSLAKLSDVCLALYHKPDFATLSFYFSPLKVVEFMALGKPVIASNFDQIKEEIEEGESGLLTDGTVNDLVKKILLLKKNSRLAKKMGRKASLKVSKCHNIGQVSKNYKSFFEVLGLFS